MAMATFRFHAELNDFIAPGRRRRDFPFPCSPTATSKHVIEALGVPHTEVELILVNGEAAGFAQRLHDGDRVEVYPRLAALAIRPPPTTGQPNLHDIRFIADAHLGGLARLLRMAGFDTLYRNDYRDDEIVQIAGREERIVLTRDRDLLKHRAIAHGCYLHATEPTQQFGELVRRLDLARRMQPLSRCLRCNAPLQAAAKDEVRDRLPPSVRQKQTRFTTCPQCRRVFWQGSHWQRMREMLAGQA